MLAARTGDDQKNPLDEFKVSAFKALPAEKVNGRDAVVIEYKVTVPQNQTAIATVWVDAATHLPLKRTLRMEMGGAPVTVTETYSAFRLNPQLDANLFVLPKAKGDPK